MRLPVRFLSSALLLTLLMLLVAAATAHEVRANTCLGLDGGPGDLDGDGVPAATDCDDGDPSVSERPSAARALQGEKLTPTNALFAWSPPLSGGPAQYDLFRADAPTGPWQCLAPSLNAPTAGDADVPLSGQAFFYVPQPRNACGEGDPGSGTTTPRGPLTCDCSLVCDDGDVCTENTCAAGQCLNPALEPEILRAPQSGATCAGSTANFSVLALGTGAPSYQWFVNGSPAGTNGPTLVLTGVSNADDGAQITVQVTDGCTSTTAGPATLSVFADAASCAGGLDGLEARNGASAPWERFRLDFGDPPAGACTDERCLLLTLYNRYYITTPTKGVGVSLLSGEVVSRELDFPRRGRGFDFEWTRTYRSRTHLDGALGRQWTHSYDRRVEPHPSGFLLLHDGSSARADSYFPSPVAPQCWETPGHFRLLCEQPDGRFVLTFADHSEWVFLALDGTPVAGRIEASVDRNGNNMTFQYDPGDGRLTQIVDTLNRPIQLVYNPVGLLEAVVDFTGRAVTYDYYEAGDLLGSAGDLKSVTTPAVTGTPHGNDFPEGKTTFYTYTTGFADDELNHNLLTITDPKGQTFLENVYTPTTIRSDPRFDRLDHQVLPSGVLSYMYTQQPPDPVLPQIVSTTIVNDRAGNVAHYAYDAQGHLLRERYFTGRAPDATRPSDASQNVPVNPLRPGDPPTFDYVRLYNNDSLPTQALHPNGNEIDLQYDSANPDPLLRGNLLQRTRFPGPLGGDQPFLQESWSYGTQFGTLDSGVENIMGNPPRRPPGSQALLTNMAQLPPATGGGSPSTSAFDAQLPYSGQLASDGELLGGLFGQEEDDILWGADPLLGGTADSRTIGGGTGSGMGTLSRGHVDPAAGLKHLHADNIVHRDLATRNMLSAAPGGDGGAGSGGRIVVRTFPTTHTDPRGLVYNYAYDGQGNLRTAQAPTVFTGTLTGGPQAILHQYDYNAFGQLELYTTPAGRVDRYTYYPAGSQTGYREQRIVDDGGLALATSYDYDSVGNVVLVADPKGNATQHIYNALDQLVATISPPPFQFETYLYYDANDNVVRLDVQNVDDNGVLDPNAFLTTEFEHDALNRLVAVEDEQDAGGVCVVEEYEYDGNDNVTRVRHGEATAGNDLGNTTRFYYDERDLVFEATRGEGSPDVSTTRFDYDPNGNPSRVRQGTEDPSGPNDTQVEYDGYDRQVRRVDAEGNETFRIYDANGNPINLRVDGEETQGAALPPVRLHEEDRLYDEVNRRVRVDRHHFEIATGNPIGDGLSTTQIFRDADDLLVRVTDDNNHSFDLDYDSARRKASTADAKANRQSYTYDANSNIVIMTDEELSDLGGLSQVYDTTLVYDELDRMIAVIDDLGQQWNITYDSRNNVRRQTDIVGNVTRYRYDGLDRPVSKEIDLTDTGTGAGTLVSTITLDFCWDDSSRQTCRVDPNGNTTSYAYDSLDRLVETTQADGTVECLIWEVHDNAVERHDAGGTTEVRTYDRLNRLKSNAVAPGTGVDGTTFESFAYDALSRLRDADDDDTLTDLAYDSLSNVLSESTQIVGSPAQTTSYTYDGVGNRLTASYPSGRVVSTLYDSLDRPSEVFSNGALAATYAYVGPQRVEFMTRPNGVDTEQSYDGLRRPEQSLHVGSGPPLVDFVTTWDAMDNAIDVADLSSGNTVQYEYDSLYRMTRSTRGPQTVATYEFDGASNRLNVTGGPDAGPYTLDSAIPPADFQVNQYTTTPRGPRAYDDNGNLLLAGGGIASEAYDYRNRLIEALDGAGNVHEYRYDALGRRVEDDKNGGTDVRRFYWSGHRLVEEQDGAGAARATWVYGGSVDERLQMHEETDLDGDFVLETYWYHEDYNRNVRALSDDVGALVESYEYDDYGRPHVFDAGGTPRGSVSGVGNPYLFHGRRWDADTALYDYLGGRYYDVHAGRYISRDALAPRDSRNPASAFDFCGSNPASGPVVRPSVQGRADYFPFLPFDPDGSLGGDASGKQLLAHELTHVVQQSASPRAEAFHPKDEFGGMPGATRNRSKPHLNIGTIGHVDHGKTTSAGIRRGSLDWIGIKIELGALGCKRDKAACAIVRGTWVKGFPCGSCLIPHYDPIEPDPSGNM